MKQRDFYKNVIKDESKALNYLQDKGICIGLSSLDVSNAKESLFKSSAEEK